MRILHILDHSIPMHSGYTFRTRNILREQHKRGWQTCHVTGLKHPSNLPLEEVEGFRFYRTPEPPGVWQSVPWLNQWQVVTTLDARLDEIIESERPQVLHAHSPALNGLAALRAGRRHGLPVVYECRAFWEDAAVDHGTSREGGLRYRVTRALESRVFREAAAVTTICEGLRKDILSRGIPGDKVTVIPNAVDPDAFTLQSDSAQDLKRELNLDDRVVLGFLGSFYAYEGLSLLVDALPALREQIPNIALVLVGGGPQEENLKAQVRRLGLEDVVTMPGRVPHESVQDYYALVDLLVYPRLHMRLTDLVTPLKPLEAMAQGKILVASDVGGHRELIEPDHTGFLFEAGDSASLERAILRALDARPVWDEMRRHGRHYVEVERNWSTSVARYQGVYEALV